MKNKKIRKGAFETNSSSTHAIAFKINDPANLLSFPVVNGKIFLKLTLENHSNIEEFSGFLQPIERFAILCSYAQVGLINTAVAVIAEHHGLSTKDVIIHHSMSLELNPGESLVRSTPQLNKEKIKYFLFSPVFHAAYGDDYLGSYELLGIEEENSDPNLYVLP